MNQTCFTSDPTLADTRLDPVFALTGSAAESVLLPALACLCIPVALFLGHCCGRGYAHLTYLDTCVQITLRTGFPVCTPTESVGWDLGYSVPQSFTAQNL